MMTFSVVLSPAQSPAPATNPPAKVIQKFDDGSYLVDIGGVRFRALTADQLRDWGKAQVDLEACQKDQKELEGQVATLNHTIDLLKKDVKIAQQDRDIVLADFARSREDTERAREDAKRNFGLFMGERELRVEAQQFIPHSQAKGFWGKVLNILDSPQSQAFFKMGVPIYQMARCQ